MIPAGVKLSFRIFSISFIVFLLVNPLTSQNTGVYKKLYYTIHLSNSSSTDFIKDQALHKSTLKSLKSFYNDSKARSRSKAYALARNIYEYSSDSEIKSQIVLDHLNGCLSDRSPSLRYQLANHLIIFDKEYFSEESRSLIKKLIAEDANKRQYIVIAGYKKLDDVLPSIENLDQKEVINSWDIIQALARIGDPEAIRHCHTIIKEHPMNIKFFDQLLPGLAFTNDQSIFDVIIEEILRNNTELIGARLKDYQRYFMLKHILPYIYEYPYRFVDEGQLTEDEFYQQLNFAMDWLHKNKSSYTLLNTDRRLDSKKSPIYSSDFSLLSF